MLPKKFVHKKNSDKPEFSKRCMAGPPGLEPEIDGPKPSVLPITPRAFEGRYVVEKQLHRQALYSTFLKKKQNHSISLFNALQPSELLTM